jgi:hypothetical protein
VSQAQGAYRLDQRHLDLRFLTHRGGEADLWDVVSTCHYLRTTDEEIEEFPGIVYELWALLGKTAGRRFIENSSPCAYVH